MNHLASPSLSARLRALLRVQWYQSPKFRFGVYGLLALCGFAMGAVGMAPVVHHEAPRALSGISITPITTTGAASSGFSFSGDAYDVSCTVSGSVTLYPAMHDGTAWTVFYGYPCALDGSVASPAACPFPARRGSGLTWNAYKTGGGSVSSCTATERFNGVPIVRAGSGGSSITTPVSVANGGTGIASYTAGDLLKATGSTTLSKLAVGSESNVLTVVSGTPAWAAPAAPAYWDNSGTVSTSGNTATDCLTITLTNNKQATYEVMVVSIDTLTLSNGASEIFYVMGNRQAGTTSTPTISSKLVTNIGTVTWTGGTIALSSGNLAIQVTGQVMTNLSWHCYYKQLAST